MKEQTTSIELINLVPFNPLISKCQIKVCWVGQQPNRNGSVITKEVATEMANSLPGSPIVGYYNEETKDFEQHNKILEISGGELKLKPTTKPYGFVDLGAKVWFQWFLDEDGITREYLVTEGWLWTGQFPECQRVIEKGNNHSMELSDDPRFLDAYWTETINGEREFFIINEAIISKLCILGEEYEPCFEGSDITAPKIEFSFGDEFKNQLFSMINEIKNILNEGGADMADEGKLNETEYKEEICEKCGKPLSECTCDKEEYKKDEEKDIEKEEEKGTEEEKTNEEQGKEEDEEDKEKKNYNLEEIAEYVELQNSYNDLQTKFNDLSAEMAKKDTELNELREFKLTTDKKEKENMIAKFYMLSDEDKKDVIDNIDTYSLDDIEAKLSILCVRNKVSFDLDQDSKDDPITYNLDNEGSEDNVPEWIKAIQANVAEN